MKYQAPYGIADPNAPYINGDPSIGRQGSIPPASCFEYPQREIVNAITNAQQVPSDDDLHQLTRVIRDGRLNYCVDTGILNQLQVTLTPPLTVLQPGITLRVLVAHSVTGPSTIVVGALAPIPIRKRDGSETAANDMLAGQIVELTSDGTVFQLASGTEASGGGGSTTYLVDIPFVVDTGTPNHLIGAYAPPLASLIMGRTVEIKLANNITGPTDFKANSFPTYAVTHPDGSPLKPGDGVAGQIWLLAFDGAGWQLQTSQVGVAPMVGQTDGLKCDVLSSTVISVTVPYCVLKDAIGNYRQISLNGVIGDISGTGVNKMDSGAATPASWLYVHGISNGINDGVVISLSKTAPVLPAGYTFSSFLCSLRTAPGAASLLGTKTRGKRTQYLVGTGALTAMPLVITGALGSLYTPTWVACSLANVIPPHATRLIFVGTMYLYSVTGNPSGGLAVAPNPNYGGLISTVNPAPYFNRVCFGINQQCTVNLPGDLIPESASIYYASDYASNVCAFAWEE